jgi:hypothetical protein
MIKGKWAIAASDQEKWFFASLWNTKTLIINLILAHLQLIFYNQMNNAFIVAICIEPRASRPPPPASGAGPPLPAGPPDLREV